MRLVRKTSTVDLEGNTYSVDPFLAGRKVELVYDPFDLTRLEVWWAGRKVGAAIPQVIGRHAHPKAPPDEDPQPVQYTGIDYLGLVAAAGHAGDGEQLRLSNPRAVNRLAITALLAACSAGKTIVDESSARTAIAEEAASTD